MDLHKDCVRSSCIGFLIIGVIVMFVTLLSVTVNRKVTQNEYVVKYNRYTCKFEDILETGKYTTSVNVEFIRLPRTYQYLNLGNLVCMSSDKVEVTLDVSMQISYQKESLIPIILKQFNNNDNYLSFLTSLAKSSILNTCAVYSAEQYYSERSKIDIQMTDNVKGVINGTVGSVVQLFQLKNILFPTNYSDVILQKQTTQQLQTTYTNDRENQITIANTNYYVANNTAEIMLINAKQQAQTILNQANTTKEIVESFWVNRAEVYNTLLKNTFNYNISSLIDYINSETVRNTANLFTRV